VKESIGSSYETASVVAPRWSRCQSIALVHQLNEHCLELLAENAASSACNAPFVSANRDLWTRLTAEARKRAALMPFVILDLNFAHEAWWRRALEMQSVRNCEPMVTQDFTPETRKRLAQETLMFAWQTARSDRTAAQVSFGMRLPVAALIAELTPGQVRDIASRKSADLQVRWADDGPFWRALLSAAESGNGEAIAELHLHAKLQLLGPLIYPLP
jgi:hypothetical protein